MLVSTRHTTALTRRRLLVAGASAGLTALGGLARPAVSRAADRPRLTHGLQFFGHVAIEGASEVMTVTLKDMGNTALWSVDIPPEPLHRIGPS